MNNTALAGIIVGAVVLAAAGAIVADSDYNPLQQYATVVSVEPAFNTTRTPRQVCGDEAAAAQMAAPDAAEAGGEKPAAAVQPPAAPADKPTEDTDCFVVFDTSSVQAGYDVTYEIDGTRDVIRMDRDPGARIPVEDGELVVSLR